MRIFIKNFQKKIPVNPIRIKKTTLKVLSCKKIKKSGEITICFVSDSKIKELNSRYLKKNKPTDVLVFDVRNPKNSAHIFSDIIISTDTAIRNAKIFKTRPLYELNLYLVHGILHLCGWDDKTMKQRKLMNSESSKILKTCLSIEPKP